MTAGFDAPSAGSTGLRGFVVGYTDVSVGDTVSSEASSRSPRFPAWMPGEANGCCIFPRLVFAQVWLLPTIEAPHSAYLRVLVSPIASAIHFLTIFSSSRQSDFVQNYVLDVN